MQEKPKVKQQRKAGLKCTLNGLGDAKKGLKYGHRCIFGHVASTVVVDIMDAIVGNYGKW